MKRRKSVCRPAIESGGAANPIAWDEFVRVEQALLADKKFKWLILWSFLGRTGMRVSEALSLRWSDIMGKNKITIRPLKRSAKVREIVFGSDLQSIINVCQASINPKQVEVWPVFRPSAGSSAIHEPMTRAGADYILKKIEAEYKVDTTISPFDIKGVEFFNFTEFSSKPVSAHTMRKTFAVRAFNILGCDNAALSMVSNLLGHSSIATTVTYIAPGRAVEQYIYNNL